METKIISTEYTGKIKTGSPKPKKKYDTPKPKVSTPESMEKKPRKRKDDTKPSKTFEKWNKETFTKDPIWAHQREQNISEKKEQLSWRKVTKKSQRSFSKNKEREYLSSKPRFEKDTEVGRGSFSNTFEKKTYGEPVDLVVVAIDEADGSSGVVGVSPFGFVKDRGDDGGGVGGDRRRDPFLFRFHIPV